MLYDLIKMAALLPCIDGNSGIIFIGETIQVYILKYQKKHRDISFLMMLLTSKLFESDLQCVLHIMKICNT